MMLFAYRSDYSLFYDCDWRMWYRSQQLLDFYLKVQWRELVFRTMSGL